MAEHLGYAPGAAPPGGAGNARSGAYDKTVTTEISEVGLRVPRDRRGIFEPTVVPKYQRRLDGLAGNVISLYAKGLTTGDIQQHPFEIYGSEVSRETTSKITGQIVDDILSRPQGSFPRRLAATRRHPMPLQSPQPLHPLAVHEEPLPS